MRLKPASLACLLLLPVMTLNAMARPFVESQAQNWLSPSILNDRARVRQSEIITSHTLLTIADRYATNDGTEKVLARGSGSSSGSEGYASAHDYFRSVWPLPSSSERGSERGSNSPKVSTGTLFSTESSGSNSDDSRGRGLVKNRFARVIRGGTPPPFSSPEPDWSKKRVPPAHRKQQRRLKAKMAAPTPAPVYETGKKQGLHGKRPAPLQIPGKTPAKPSKKLYEFLNLGNPDDWKKPAPAPKRPFQNLNLNGIPGSPPPRAWEPSAQKQKGAASKMGGMAKKSAGKIKSGFKKLFGKRSVTGVDETPAPGGGFFMRHTKAASSPIFRNGPQFFKSQTAAETKGKGPALQLPPDRPVRFKALEPGPSSSRPLKSPYHKDTPHPFNAPDHGIAKAPARGGGFYFKHTKPATQPIFPDGPKFFKKAEPLKLPPQRPGRLKLWEHLQEPNPAASPEKEKKKKKKKGAMHTAKKAFGKIGKLFFI